MKIGLDLDDTIFNFVDPYFMYLSSIYARAIRREDLTTYSAEGSGIIPKGSGYKHLLDFCNAGGMRYLPFIPGAKSGLNRIIHLSP